MTISFNLQKGVIAFNLQKGQSCANFHEEISFSFKRQTLWGGSKTNEKLFHVLMVFRREDGVLRTSYCNDIPKVDKDDVVLSASINQD